MHGPTCVFWASLTFFSLKAADVTIVVLASSSTEGHDRVNISLGGDKLVCRGTSARVTIDQFRPLTLQMFKKHRTSSNIFSNKFFKYLVL